MWKGPLESGEVERKLGEGISGQTLVIEGTKNSAVSHLTRSGLSVSFKMISGDCLYWVQNGTSSNRLTILWQISNHQLRSGSRHKYLRALKLMDGCNMKLSLNTSFGTFDLSSEELNYYV